MAEIKLAYNKNTKTAYLVTDGANTPTGSVLVGSFEHDTTNDPLGYPLGHAIYQHVRNVLYQCSAANPTERAMYPDNIFDIRNINIFIAGQPVITKSTITTKEVIPFETERQNNPTLAVGVEQVSQSGSNGERTIVTEITYTDGVETDRREVSNTITRQPVKQIIQVGTMVVPASISVAPKTMSLDVGAKETITPTVLPANASDKSVTYVSDKTAIASVTASGEVLAVAEGTATITVKTVVGGLIDTVSVTVTPVEPDGE